MRKKQIIYIPSIKKNITTNDRDIFLMPGIDIIIIDYILTKFENIEITYMPFEDERKDFVNKINDIFSKKDRFHFNYFSYKNFLNLITSNEDLILITDILKVGIFFSLKTLKPALFYIPFLQSQNKLKDLTGLSQLIIKFTNLYELDELLFKNFNLSKIIKNFSRRELI